MSGDISGVEQTTVDPIRQAVESIVKATQDHGKPEARLGGQGKNNTLSFGINYGELQPETQAMLTSTHLPVAAPLQIEVISTEDANGKVTDIEIRYSGWPAKENSYQAKWVTLRFDPENPSNTKLGVKADMDLPHTSIENISPARDKEYLRTRYTIPDSLKSYTKEKDGNLGPLITEASELIGKQPRFSYNGLKN